MSSYVSVAEASKAIRQELKRKHGWTSRDISVRSESYSMGSSIHINVKRSTIPLEPVEAIANQAQDISRCSITGDILSGGNRFVTVRYTSEAEEELAAPYLEAVEALPMPDEGDSSLHPIGDCHAHRTDAFGQFAVSVGGDNGRIVGACSAKYAAILIARNTKPKRIECEPQPNGCEIQQHTHTKKGFQYSLVVLASRVERDEFNSLRDRA